MEFLKVTTSEKIILEKPMLSLEWRNSRMERPQVRMRSLSGKLVSGIKSMYVDSSACVRVEEGESESFRIDNGMRQVCIIPIWLFNI